MSGKIASAILVAALLNCGNAHAITTCKASIKAKTGAIQINAAGIGTNPQWGGSAGAVNVSFFDLGTCFNPTTHKLAKCHLGAPGTLAERTPPEGCMVFVTDSTNIICQTLIRGCTPGARLRDVSFTDANDPRGTTLDNLANQGSQITALTNQNAQQSSQISTLNSATFHPGASLNGANLANVQLNGLDLTGVNFGNANLSGANLAGATLANAFLEGANLTGAVLSGVNLTGAYTTALVGGCPSSLPASWHCVVANGSTNLVGPGAILNSANLSGVDLSGYDLTNTDLSYTNLSGANLTGATLTGTKLIYLTGGCPTALPISFQCVGANGSYYIVGPGVNLMQSSLGGANLSGADLAGANLMGADLNSADLSAAVLGGAVLKNVYLNNANLSTANLSGADLTNANLNGANLTGANLAGATLAGTQATYLAGSCPAALPASFQCVNANGAYFIAGPGQTLSLEYVNLNGVVLNNVDLSHADLYGANFDGATLSSVILVGAHFGFGYFDGATLTNVDLSTADLSGTSFNGTTLSGIVWSSTKCSDGSNSSTNGTSPESCCGHLSGPPNSCSP